MFGIGFGELLVIAVLVLVAVGPNRLPTMLKSVVKGYREFRRVTRDLRASTGIDQILNEDELKARKPLYVPPKAERKAAAAPVPRRRALTVDDEVRELPPEGPDISTIRVLEQRGTGAAVAQSAALTEEQQRFVAEKQAAQRKADEEWAKKTEEERIAEKIARAQSGGTEEDKRIIAAKLAAAQQPTEEEQRIIDAKIAAARSQEEERVAAKNARTPEEEERIIAAKIAAAQGPSSQPDDEEEEDEEEQQRASGDR
jgi:Tat protein translocase TatB subunit